MKEVSLTNFKLMKVSDIKDGGSFKLTADGEVIEMVMIPLSGEKNKF